MTFTVSVPVYRFSSSGSVLDMKPHGHGFNPTCTNIFYYCLLFTV